MPTVKVTPVKTGVFKERENLAAFVARYIPKLQNGSILVVTSKIVALAEGSVVAATTPRAKDALIRAESDWQLQAKGGKITLKDGLLMWNAGIDESNAKGNVILLPKDSFKAAARLRKALMRQFHIRNCGVIISDSRVMLLRAGVVGIALGYAGFKGVRDYRGQKDMFGRKLKFTQTDIADSLATAAALVMGEGSEQQPLCVIEDAPVEFVNRVNKKELLIPMKDDMYAPLFGRVVRSRRTKN
ncbi:MAG: coenzyme F420-0:L-glutamate ligase [Patescibacteria group bacterium]